MSTAVRPDLRPRPAADVPRLRRLLVGVALISSAAAFAGLPARATDGARTTADEPYYLLTAQSLATDGDLDIGPELAERTYEPYHAIRIDPQTTPLDAGGRQLSPHDPLLPVLLAPAMAVGGWVAAKALLAVLTGLTAALATWVAVRRFGVAPRVAGLVVGGLFIGMPLAPYGTQVYPELPAALAVLIGTAAISAIGTIPRSSTSSGTGASETELMHSLPVLGACTAIVALPWLSVKYVPVAAVLALLGGRRLWTAGRTRTVVLAAGALAAAGVIYLLAHQAMYGGWTVYAAGDHFTETGELSVVGVDPSYLGRARRLPGLLLDRTFGIGTWAPAWLLAPAAVAAVVVRRHPDRWLLLAPLAAGWTTATFVALTMHGWWVPGRQIVIVLPLAAIAIAVLVDALPRLRPPVAVLLLAGAGSWLWLAVEASTGRRTLVVDFFETTAPAYRALATVMPDGLAAGPASDAVLAAWTVALGLSVVLTVRRVSRDGPTVTLEPDSSRTLQKTDC